jgi:hypothetical protein
LRGAEIGVMAIGDFFGGEANFVPADSKMTTRADCALTCVCRKAAVVNRRSA